MMRFSHLLYLASAAMVGAGAAADPLFHSGSIERGEVAAAISAPGPTDRIAEPAASDVALWKDDEQTPAGLILSVRGDCRWSLGISWQNATPYRRMGIAVADGVGNFTLPGGVCGGTRLGLSSRGLQLLYQGRTGSTGSGGINRNYHGALCGTAIQMIVEDGNPCSTSNVVEIVRR